MWGGMAVFFFFHFSHISNAIHVMCTGEFWENAANRHLFKGGRVHRVHQTQEGKGPQVGCGQVGHTLTRRGRPSCWELGVRGHWGD